MDRGANGGVIGIDACVLNWYPKFVNIWGIGEHQLKKLRMCDAAAKVLSHRGPIIVILHHYAFRGTGRTIHSVGQIEYYKNKVYDSSMHVGGYQCIVTHDGYTLPLDFVNGLPYLRMSKFTEEDWNSLPHIPLTGPQFWNPRVLDYNLSKERDWSERLSKLDQGLIDTPFDQVGDYKDRTPIHPGARPVTRTQPVPALLASQDHDELNDSSDDDASLDDRSYMDSSAASLPDSLVSTDYHESMETRVTDFKEAFHIALDCNMHVFSGEFVYESPCTT